jgi:hypothetical protein
MPDPAAVTWLSTADMAVRFRTSEGTIRYWRYSGTQHQRLKERWAP